MPTGCRLRAEPQLRQPVHPQGRCRRWAWTWRCSNGSSSGSVNLGYRPVTGRSSLTWTITRLLLWRGDPDIAAITYDDIMAFGEEISRYCALPEAGFIRASHVSNARRREPLDKPPPSVEKRAGPGCSSCTSCCSTPARSARSHAWTRQGSDLETGTDPAGHPAAIAAPIDRWLSGRLQTTDRAESVRHARDAFRYLLRWLADAHPEITSLAELTRDHVEGYLAHLHDHINPRSGKPLAARTRYVYISPLLQFFRETSQWGWDDVPSRPLLGRSDLPKTPSRLPRFIPREELDRLMEAIEELEDPYQRTALLLVRWSGARRGEISRLPSTAWTPIPTATRGCGSRSARPTPSA